MSLKLYKHVEGKSTTKIRITFCMPTNDTADDQPKGRKRVLTEGNPLNLVQIPISPEMHRYYIWDGKEAAKTIIAALR